MLKSRSARSVAKKTPEVVSLRYVVGWFLALAFPFVLGMTGVFDVGDATMNAQVFSAIFGTAIFMWMFDVVPSFVPGLFIILSSVTLGIVPHKVILSGFSSISFVMALSFLGLGSAVMASALPDRFYNFLKRFNPESFTWRLVALMTVGNFMTMTVPTVPGTGVRLDMLKAMLRNFTLTNARERFLAVLQILQGAQLLSPVFLSGSTLNFILLSLLRAQEQFNFQWLGWVQAMLFFGAIVLVGHLCLGWLISRFIGKDRKSKAAHIKFEESRGELRLNDWIALGCFAIFCLGLLTSGLHKIYPAWLALLILYILLLYNVLPQEDFRHKIPWEAMILLGSLSGTLAALNHMNVSVQLGDRLEWLGSYMAVDFARFLSVLAGVVWVVRLLVPFGITAIILSAIFVPVSYQKGVNSWCVAISIVVLAQCWFFPYQSAEYRKIQEDFGKEQDRYFLSYNALMNVIRLGALYVSLGYWGRLGLL